MDFDILTFHRAYNYGAVLQACALQEFVHQLGFSCGVYDYNPPTANASVGGKAKLLKIVQQFNKKDILLRQERFHSFVGRFLNLNQDTNCSYYIAGSDQVWNPKGQMDPMFFLRFADPEAVRVSYAASLGAQDIPEDRAPLFREYLNDFDFLSVREKFDCERLRAVTDKEIAVHMDPSFLHDADFWQDKMTKVNGIPERYTLMYLLHKPKNINLLVKWLKKETGNPVVLIDGQGAVQGCLAWLVKHDKMVQGIGPAEFLWLISHAQSVITSSFHGTAFSIVFQKEFYAVTREGNTRISHLLDLLGLQPVLESDQSFQRNNQINWDTVFSEIQRERDKAKDYFLQIVQKEGK